MERLILKRLLEWKNSPYRKPLILKGVRQVGKTWILKEFGRRYYDNTAYFNFDEHEEYKQFFETTKDVDRLLQNLMLASGQKITPEKTLIIFDEVQDCPKVINSMKYFCENAPQYHIACAGSLLGIALAKPSSFPVGKVNFMQIDPMTFTEFLLANGDENLANYLDAVDTLEPLPDAFFNPLYEKLKMYYVTGGMPESVLMWTQARDVEAMQEALSGIIGAYERDFAKHPNVSEFPKISMIWKSVPSQLARENKKFIYKVVKEGARAREYGTRCNGWWMPGLSTRYTAAPHRDFRCRPMTICRRSKSIWWMWDCSAVWRSLHRLLLVRAIACLPSSKER